MSHDDIYDEAERGLRLSRTRLTPEEAAERLERVAADLRQTVRKASPSDPEIVTGGQRRFSILVDVLVDFDRGQDGEIPIDINIMWKGMRPMSLDVDELNARVGRMVLHAVGEAIREPGLAPPAEMVRA